MAQSLSLLAQQSGLLGLNPFSSPQLGTSPSARISSLDLQVARDQVQISAYGMLLAALSDFRSSMQALKLPGFITQVTGTSSSPAVASVATSGAGYPSLGNPRISGASPGVFNLSVTSLAQAQSLRSGTFADPGTSAVGTGTMTFRVGTYNAGLNTFTEGSLAAVTVTISTNNLNGIAAAINASGAPATASVVQDGANYRLLISSRTTGTQSSLKITVDDDDTTDTDMSGLSQLAFDPVAAVGAGENLTEAQAAANAAYTVNGQANVSQTNTGVVLAPRVTANFLTTGSTVLTLGADYTGTRDSAEALIEAFNSVQGSLNELTANLGPLAGDMVTSTIIRGLNSIPLKTFSNSSSATLTTLRSVGVLLQIETNPGSGAIFGNGRSLTLNASTLESTFSSSPNGVVELLAAAVQEFETFSESYVGGGGTVHKATSALQRNLYVDRYLAEQFRASKAPTLPSIEELLSSNARRSGARAPLTAGQIQAAQQYAQNLMLFAPPGSTNPLLVQALLNPASSSGGGFSAFA